MTEQSKSGGKTVLIVVVLLVGALAIFGYARQSTTMKNTSADAQNQEAKAEAKPIDSASLKPRANDIILGDANALVTIVEYSSLTCPHCAHFHKDVLPLLEKEFIDTGKARLVMRYFPLNEPAVKASEIVECSGTKGNRRATFMKVLFDMQDKWAFSENYLKDLKQIALVGGMDSAAFDSCINDKDLETRILLYRQEAAENLHIESTPSFFINGKKLEGAPTIERFREAIAEATPKQ